MRGATARRFGATERGQSIVEVALALPVLLVVLIGTFDGVRALLAAVVLQSAVLAGAQYGALSPTNAADTAGIEDATRDEVALPQASATNPTVGTTTATDGQGELRITVTATFTQTVLLPYPGLPDRFTITRSAALQVRR